MNKERAFEVLNRLSFNRVSATADELKAANLLKEECEKMGVKVWLEEFSVPAPTVHKVKFEVTKPFQKEIYCTGQGISGNTPDEGIVAPLVYIHDGNDLYTLDVKDKIVLSTGGMQVPLRKKLVEKGALGYVCTWGGIFDDEIMKSQVPHRFARLAAGDESNFPGVMMNLATAEELVHSHPEEVRLILQQDPTTTATSQNVVAEIEGTDLKDEIVVFSAHYDSVEFSSGAWDNATGSVTLLELAHYYKKHQPRRTVRFVWCGCEEIGLKGSDAYCESHKDELGKHILNINFDMTGVLFGEDSVFASCDKSVLEHCKFMAKTLGKHLGAGFMGREIGLASTDSTSFALHEVPAITFGSHAVRGGAVIHSRLDTIDRLDPDRFMELCNFIAPWSESIINAPVNVVPRKLPEEVMQQKEQLKARLGGK